MRKTRFDAVLGALVDWGRVSITHNMTGMTQPIAQHPIATSKYITHGHFVSLKRSGLVPQGIRVPAGLFQEDK